MKEVEHLLTYHSTVRQSLQNFDTLQLRAASSAITSAGALIGIAATLLTAPLVYGLPLAIAGVGGFVLSLIATSSISFFKEKVDLFGDFIAAGVKVGLQIEKNVDLDARMGLTHVYELSDKAGNRDIKIFNQIIAAFQILAAMLIVISISYICLALCIFASDYFGLGPLDIRGMIPSGEA